MTFQQLTARVKGGIGLSTTPFVSDARVEAWCNEAYIAVCATFNLPREIDTLTSVVAQQSYSLASNVVRVLEVTYDGGPPLEPTTYRACLQHTDQGEPAYWARWADSLLLLPIPSEAEKTILVYHIARPVKLAATSDVLVLPQELEDVVAYDAIWRGLAETNAPNAIQAQQRSQILCEQARLRAGVTPETPTRISAWRPGYRG